MYFSKAVLAGRSKPLQSIILSSVPILRRTTHAQFSSILLPATLKCLLRNPDELLEGKSPAAYGSPHVANSCVTADVN